MHHYSSHGGLFTHRLASKQSMWIGDFSGIIYPVTNYHFQLLTCIIMITQYISYYPNHVRVVHREEAWQMKSVVSNNWSEFTWETILWTTELSI